MRHRIALLLSLLQLGLLQLALLRLAAAGQFPSAPSGYKFLHHHSIGDSAACRKTQCHNINQPNLLCGCGKCTNAACKPCAKSPGAKDCMGLASAACDTIPDCDGWAL
jgi:hypothetical protein